MQKKRKKLADYVKKSHNLQVFGAICANFSELLRVLCKKDNIMTGQERRIPFPDYTPEHQEGDCASYKHGYGKSTMLKNIEVFIVRVDKKWNALIVGKRSTHIIQPDGNPDISEFRAQLVEDFQEEGYYPRIRHLDNTGLEFRRDPELNFKIEQLVKAKGGQGR